MSVEEINQGNFDQATNSPFSGAKTEPFEVQGQPTMSMQQIDAEIQRLLNLRAKLLAGSTIPQQPQIVQVPATRARQQMAAATG